MPDIVTRLRQWAIATDAVPASDLMDEAAAEIERLRAQPCTLTDAEREAIRFAAVVYEQGGRAADAATLRGLLERTRNGTLGGCETGK